MPNHRAYGTACISARPEAQYNTLATEGAQSFTVNLVKRHTVARVLRLAVAGGITDFVQTNLNGRRINQLLA